MTAVDALVVSRCQFCSSSALSQLKSSTARHLTRLSHRCHNGLEAPDFAGSPGGSRIEDKQAESP